MVLDQKLVEVVRKEELDFMKKIQLYEEVPVEQSWRMTGKPPVDT